MSTHAKRFQKNLESKIVKENGSIAFNCDRKAPPDTSLVWIRNSDALIHSSRMVVSVNSTLIAPNLSYVSIL